MLEFGEGVEAAAVGCSNSFSMPVFVFLIVTVAFAMSNLGSDLGYRAADGGGGRLTEGFSGEC